MSDDDHKDPPIEQLGYLSGPTVVDIGDIRVARGKSRRPFSACKHKVLHYDKEERRIWCADCERDIDAFDAVVSLSENIDAAWKKLNLRAEKVADAEKHALFSRAAKEVDKVWRSRNMVPACPHCRDGLLPEYFANGDSTCLGREYAEARIRAKTK